MRQKFEYYNEYRQYLDEKFDVIERKIRDEQEELQRKIDEANRLAEEELLAKQKEEAERIAKAQADAKRLADAQADKDRLARLKKQQHERFLFKIKIVVVGVIFALCYYVYYKYYPKQDTIVYDDGSVYMGKVKNGKANDANGRMAYGDSKECVGAFVDDVLSGYGECIYPNGGRYVGTFVDGKRNGYGEFFMANGNIYKGDFVLGDLHGQGELLYAESGIIYKGNFEYNKIYGQGKIFGKDDESEACVGVFTDKLIECKTKEGYSVSSQYNAKTMQFHGKATVTFPSGEQIKGNYINNVFNEQSD